MLNVKPYGPTALLVTFADEIGDEAFNRCQSLLHDLDQNPFPEVIEIVPAFTTLLLIFEPREKRRWNEITQELVERFARASNTPPIMPVPREIPVIYNGEDLEEVATSKGLTLSELAEIHSAPIYKVYMLGFSPGFPYLGELPNELIMPRRAEPRVRVKAGSVAIGGAHTGIYSVDSPGGWHIIGNTQVKIFDPKRGEIRNDPEASFFLKPGDRVKFVPTFV